MGWQDDLSSLVGEVMPPRPSGTPTLDWTRHFIPPETPPVSSDEMTVLDPLVQAPGWAQIVSGIMGGTPDPKKKTAAPISPIPAPWKEDDRDLLGRVMT